MRMGEAFSLKGNCKQRKRTVLRANSRYVCSGYLILTFFSATICSGEQCENEIKLILPQMLRQYKVEKISLSN